MKRFFIGLADWTLDALVATGLFFVVAPEAPSILVTFLPASYATNGKTVITDMPVYRELFSVPAPP